MTKYPLAVHNAIQIKETRKLTVALAVEEAEATALLVASAAAILVVEAHRVSLKVNVSTVAATTAFS